MVNQSLADIAVSYQPQTLGSVISKLAEMPPETLVVGMGGTIFSYRGYYERAAVSYMEGDWHTAGRLVELYRGQLGGTMYGYKGGEWPISEDELMYITGDRSDTGMLILGFLALGSVARPVLLSQDYV